jgi:hypothetical protein
MNAAATASAPGRSCPLQYRYRPEVFASAAPPALQGLEVLYVVGGLYGNALALQQVLRLFGRERGNKRLVFNGDFHRFDADAATFAQVQHGVLAHSALRGNVETELANDAADDGSGGAGCGCAYPDWVDDATVQRSNRILRRLRTAVAPAQRAQLAVLPMWLRADVGALRIGIVHGDAQSLAGWGFAREHLADSAHRAEVRRWFTAAQVDAFASTHTCLPVFQTLAGGHAVYNNGAAGMPNFAGDNAGLLTRIALQPFAGAQRRFGVIQRGVHVEAIAIDTDAPAAQRQFLACWPPGSDAHASYFERIVRGPAYAPAQMLRSEG